MEKRKRVGILTFHDQLNYGGVLQAFALKEMIASFKTYDTEIIHLWHDSRDTALLGKETNPNIPLLSRLRNRLKARKRPFGRQAFAERRLKTKQLIYSKLALSKETYRTGAALSHLPHYDTVVIGSDQVWNPFLKPPTGRPEENAFLGTFLPEGQRRVAYAASFGTAALPADMYEAYRQQLQKYSAVTVRETSGAALYADIMGGVNKPHVVLDPTLLITPNQWHAYVRDIQRPKGNYLLSYWIGTCTSAQKEWLIALSERFQMPIVMLVSNPLAYDFAVPDKIITRYDADPFDFVALIENCKGIVTNSFHGMIFATMFERNGAFVLPKNIEDVTGPSRFLDFFKRYEIDAPIYAPRDFVDGKIPLEDFEMKPLKMNPAHFNTDLSHSLAQLHEMLP